MASRIAALATGFDKLSENREIFKFALIKELSNTSGGRIICSHKGMKVADHFVGNACIRSNDVEKCFIWPIGGLNERRRKAKSFLEDLVGLIAE